jgi:hypothetical protein
VRKLLTLLAAMLAALTLAVSPAGAVTNGVPDGTEHPYVGLVVFYDEAGNPLHRCSGSLISPTVFLTAGHCTFETASAQVWFEPTVTLESGYPLSGGITGTPYTYPCYDDFATFPNTCDLGIVVLDERVRLSEYGTLAAVGFLDRLATRRGQQEVLFTVVGYGLQEVKPVYSAERTRYRGTVQLVNLSSALTDGYNIHTTSNPGVPHSGGTCFGDSGGPVLYGDTNTIVAVTSFGLNQHCKGADFAYRVDLAAAQEWINSFLK